MVKAELAAEKQVRLHLTWYRRLGFRSIYVNHDVAHLVAEAQSFEILVQLIIPLLKHANMHGVPC